jgi:hypothetical protein
VFLKTTTGGTGGRQQQSSSKVVLERCCISVDFLLPVFGSIFALSLVLSVAVAPAAPQSLLPRLAVLLQRTTLRVNVFVDL